MQDGSREWVSLLECISMDGGILAPQIIFKAKKKQAEWAWVIQDRATNITFLETRWTNNKIGLFWFKETFKPQSWARMNGEDCYRLLFLDGHASHITREAIKFRENNKIILLCLPSHFTHLLQPLGVGIFGPFALTYKRILEQSVRPGAGYHIENFFVNVPKSKSRMSLKGTGLLSFQKIKIQTFQSWFNPSKPARYSFKKRLGTKQKNCYRANRLVSLLGLILCQFIIYCTISVISKPALLPLEIPHKSINYWIMQ